MYDKVNEDRGILNDFDLAHLSEKPRPSNTKRTGTMPFMALDLLTEDAWDGKIPRLYRHDCESFAWVLLWICCRYEDGKEIHEAPLSDLITHDFEVCLGKKSGLILRNFANLAPRKPYETFWDAVKKLFYFHHDLQIAINRRQMQEPTVDEVFETYRKVGFMDLS